MILIIVFAFLAGIVTILSPCILPLLPVILSGSVSGGKARPLGIITGFVASFTIFTLTLSALVQALGISADVLRWVSAGVIIAFGLVMVIPPFKNVFMRLVSRLASSGVPAQQTTQKNGFISGLTLGLSLGMVWTPCVGPIMASVITLALSSTVDLGSIIITLTYSLGTALPLFLIMQGGRSLLNRFPFFNRHSASIQKVFGVLMLLTGIALFTGFDRQFQTAVLTAFPSYGQGLTQIEDQGFIKDALEKRQNQLLNVPGAESSAAAVKPLSAGNEPSMQSAGEDSLPKMQPAGGGTVSKIQSEGNNTKIGSAGPADEAQAGSIYDSLVLGGMWINSEPLRPSSLRGKVVLIDFWTYSCINCIRTFPYLKAWDEKYRDRGLLIIGVHSPEFAFEREIQNVKKAVQEFGIKYPVVQDNDFAVWKAFNNRYWPAHYFFDKGGELVYSHFGEGAYEESEQLIQKLLGQSEPLAVDEVNPTLPTARDRTPETYLGYGRANNFASPEAGIRDTVWVFSLPPGLKQNQWALSGRWIQEEENILALSNAVLELSFRAERVYLVLGPAREGSSVIVTVTVNGNNAETADVKNGRLELKEYRLYELYKGDKPVNGLLRLKITGLLKAYAFTFG